jgi:hypothetical protein
MGKIIERTFSGYRLNLPKGLRLFAVDVVTNQRYDLSDDLHYWMRQPIWVIKELLRSKKEEVHG